MKLTVSTPMQLVLAATLVGSVVSLLQPDPAELPVLTEPTDNASAGSQATALVRADQPDVPWQRPRLPDPAETANAPASNAASGPPPLPPADSLSNPDNPPPLPSAEPPRSTARDIVYLGRMIRDGKTQVFLASNGKEPIVLGRGGVLDGNWTIQSISSTNVTLRHVHTGEARSIAMGSGTGSRQTDEAPTQLGQGFLAGNPADVQVHPVP
ncbi:hypothetical protein [Burkholderia sp. BCC1977]|uniref:hypothetical protein n=1 Tax=Burkholderia sp. BCC1977 TaxID=2817440 RepID=UPI002ABDFAE7|nr:hypothetical protein [Burkholderia sp. BCC1977]